MCGHPDRSYLCAHQYFVLEGLLRMYHTDAEGNQHIEMFVIENWWVTHMDSFVNGIRSSSSLQALEASKLLVIERAKLETLFLNEICNKYAQLQQLSVRKLHTVSKVYIFHQRTANGTAKHR